MTMPILECDPWREQYFERVPCPPEVIVPTDDPESWRLFPAHRWVFNKLAICATQGLEHGPHGVPPTRYPVFSKPIYNLKGMGIGSRLIRSAGFRPIRPADSQPAPRLAAHHRRP